MQNLLKIGLLTLCIACFFSAGAQTEVMYYTSMGSFKVRLTDTLTPRTVDSFIARVADKYYDGQIFHRVIDFFMIQGGDPLGTGSGGPGYSFPDEFKPTLKNVPGALAMANLGPNTNGSQFFINLVTNSHLDNHHTVFGMVITNFTVVQSIGHVATDSIDRPLVNVRLDSIRITHLYVPASVTHIANGTGLFVHPNPCNGVFSIDLPAVDTKVEIVNMLGRVVYSKETNGTLTVNIPAQQAGLYFVRISNIYGTAESRLIIL